MHNLISMKRKEFTFKVINLFKSRKDTRDENRSKIEEIDIYEELFISCKRRFLSVLAAFRKADEGIPVTRPTLLPGKSAE